MEDLTNAIDLAMISVDPVLKEQAMSYCNRIKESPDGWQICLKTAQIAKKPEIRFFCFQVLEDFLRNRFTSLNRNQILDIRNSTWQFLSEHIQTNFPYFLRNKLFILIVLLFKNEYPTQWPSFFDDLFSITRSGSQEASLEAFLNICCIIDEEIVCLYIQRSPEELAHNTFIKDTMRDNSNAIPRLVETWHSIFNTFYRSNFGISTLCLKIFGLYVSWVDIGLIMQENFIIALYESFSITELRISAAECLGNVIMKGMKPSAKLEFIKAIRIIQFLTELKFSDDPEFDESVAKLINNIGLELCHCYEDQFSSEAEKYLSLELLDSLFPNLLRYLSNEYDDTTSALFQYLGSYLLLFKRDSKNTTFPTISQDKLRALLEVLAIKMKFDIDDDYRSAADAGEDEALFAEMRKTLKVHFDSIFAIDENLFTSCICEVVCNVLDGVKPPTSAIANFEACTWVDAELSIYLIYIFVEAKTTKG